MDDMISRAAAIAKVKEARKAARTLTGMDFVMMLEKQPTVDAAPVETAHYVEGSGGEWYCSNCKRIDEKYSVARYCWYCGAKMDGERMESE